MRGKNEEFKRHGKHGKGHLTHIQYGSSLHNADMPQYKQGGQNMASQTLHRHHAYGPHPQTIATPMLQLWGCKNNTSTGLAVINSLASLSSLIPL